MTVRITITPEARERLERLQTEVRARLERPFGRRPVTGTPQLGTTESEIPQRPFLRQALNEQRPAIEKKLKGAKYGRRTN